MFFPSVNIYSKIMKITHIQVRRFVSKPYFSTESPSTAIALCLRETSACMSCQYYSLSGSCSQDLTALITSSSVFTPQTALFSAPKRWKSEGARSGFRMDGLSLSNQIVWWLSKSSHLCVILVGNLYSFVHKWRGRQRCTT
jgi:hypothetical protein